MLTFGGVLSQSLSAESFELFNFPLMVGQDLILKTLVCLFVLKRPAYTSYPWKGGMKKYVKPKEDIKAVMNSTVHNVLFVQ